MKKTLKFRSVIAILVCLTFLFAMVPTVHALDPNAPVITAANNPDLYWALYGFSAGAIDTSNPSAHELTIGELTAYDNGSHRIWIDGNDSLWPNQTHKIRNIEGLQYLGNITWLSFENNEISDISPLAGMTWLTRLDFHNNLITDTTPLADKNSLTFLNMNNNKIQTIGHLTMAMDGPPYSWAYYNYNQLTSSSLNDLYGNSTISGMQVNYNYINPNDPIVWDVATHMRAAPYDSSVLGTNGTLQFPSGQNKIRIHYDGGAYGAPTIYVTESTKYYNEQIPTMVLSSITPGWNFLGWDNGSNNGIVAYPFSNPNMNIAPPLPLNADPGTHVADVTLHAVYSPITYTVNFDKQDGSTATSITTGYHTTISKPASPVWTGHTFVGWYAESDCITPWNFISDIVTGDMTLYAKWTVTPQYTISTSVNNTHYGSVSGAGPYYSGTMARVKGVPKAGYRFVRWLEGTRRVSTTAVYEFPVTGNRTLKGEFALIAKPSLISAAASGHNAIKLKWKAVKGAAGYEIYRATRIGGTYTKKGTVSSLSFTNTGLTSKKKYYYKIKAYCMAGTYKTISRFSNIKSATAK